MASRKRKTRSQVTTSYRYYHHILSIKNEHNRRVDRALEAGAEPPFSTFAKIAQFKASTKAENELRARRDRESFKNYVELHRPLENWRPYVILVPETWGTFEIWLEYRGTWSSIEEAKAVRAELDRLWRTKDGRRALHHLMLAESETLRRTIFENRQQEAPAV